jgi:hypothetical protein
LVEHALLDDLVGPEQERLRDRQAEGLCGLHVDELARLLDGQVSGFRAVEDFAPNLRRFVISKSS